MSVDGLRAWIGEVERKLRMRTRVFLALGVIAIGVGGAAIYLALDTRSDAVSEGDVRALQEQLEGQFGTAGATSTTQLQAEVNELREQLREVEEKGGASKRGASAGSGGGPGAYGASGTGGKNLPELLQQAKESSEAAE